MLSPEINYLVSQEQHRDRLRGIRQQQLIQIAGHQQAVDWHSYRKAICWLGDQMVKWGAKLQGYGATSPANNMIAKTQRG